MINIAIKSEILRFYTLRYFRCCWILRCKHFHSDTPTTYMYVLAGLVQKRLASSSRDWTELRRVIRFEFILVQFCARVRIWKTKLKKSDRIFESIFCWSTVNFETFVVFYFCFRYLFINKYGCKRMWAMPECLHLTQWVYENVGVVRLDVVKVTAKQKSKNTILFFPIRRQSRARTLELIQGST